MKPRILFHFYSAFVFLLESIKTSSMVEKSLNKSFETSYAYLGGRGGGGGAPNIRPQMMSFKLNLSPEISTLAPLVFMIESSPGLYLMERRNTCLTICKLPIFYV